MAMDALKKAELLRRVSVALDNDEEITSAIKNRRWDQFNRWMQRTCADIWDSVKKFAKDIWDKVISWL